MSALKSSSSVSFATLVDPLNRLRYSRNSLARPHVALLFLLSTGNSNAQPGATAFFPHVVATYISLIQVIPWMSCLSRDPCRSVVFLAEWPDAPSASTAKRWLAAQAGCKGAASTDE